MSNSPDIARLRRFVVGLAAEIERTPDPQELRCIAGPLLADLVRTDDWLPAAYAEPHPDRYLQYLLHCDSRQRFSVVSFVWGAGHATPIHDHGVWGMIGMLRGAEIAQTYVRTERGGLAATGAPIRLEPGDVDHISPATGDIHSVRNAFDDRPSVSIHIYGGNIGAIRRSTYDAEGNRRPFVSGYSNATLPNLWDLSGAATATGR